MGVGYEIYGNNEKKITVVNSYIKFGHSTSMHFQKKHETFYILEGAWI